MVPRLSSKNQDNVYAYMTIFRFPIAETAANSLGDGKSPKLVSSDHCHISGRYTIIATYLKKKLFEGEA